MRIALAQLNPVVGDFEGNAKRILEPPSQPCANSWRRRRRNASIAH